MGATAYPTEAFRIGGFRGRIVSAWKPAPTHRELAAELGRLLDPASVERTLHWGRNYIYLARLATPEGPLPVAVKQFSNEGWRKRLRRRWKGTKAEQSWRVARALREAGISTPEPVLYADSERPEGPAYFVTRHLRGAFEARYLFRAIHGGRAEELYPHVDVERFLRLLAREIRRLHDTRFFHRDLSSGNVLVDWPQPGDRAVPRLYLVDLNRTRVGRRLTISQRTRDLSRLMIFRPEHQRLFVASYWGVELRELGLFEWSLFRLYHQAFLAKNRWKKKVRGTLRWIKSWLVPRGTHGHIPEAPKDARPRDKVVWDYLSDQPHLHAGRFEKVAARLVDAGAHLTQATALVTSLPRIRRRYRELKESLYREPVPFFGAGVAVRPPADPARDATLLHALDELGARHVLLRLHPWEADHDREEALARSLFERNLEITFALPQNRDLVKDLTVGGSRWADAVEELARRFTPYGRHFQVGQAINRSKWGVWNHREYGALAATAAEILYRHREDVEILGPAVIDFEVHVTAAVVNARDLGVRFDALASLLYVDRRGAPENRQLGFNSVDKAVILQAIADTARHCAGRSWITEVNWPLQEGPHSPAGKSVSVDEETQADYLVRFFLMTLGTGLVERVFWWRMAAKGYGLIDPTGDEGWRRRPSYRAFQVLIRSLEGASFRGPLPARPPAWLYRFTRNDGGEVVVGWSSRGRVEVELPSRPQQAWSRDGDALCASQGTTMEVVESPRYFEL